MKLRPSERIAIAITAAFLLLVLGIRIGTGRHSVPVTVNTTQESQMLPLPPQQDQSEPEEAPVNLNTATLEELDTLDGVGPALAERIIKYREEHGPFAAVEDITRVQGIAEKVYTENRARLRVN